MLNTVIAWLKERKGFLSRKGAIVNYDEAHALGLGLIDGFGFKGQGYRLEYWRKNHPDVNKKTIHYYEKGYFWTRLLKYVATISFLLYFYGPDAVRTIFLA